ncbi:MAG: hypothetical protein DMF84_24440 [Acidobacteria bacterium]|nr:MAG: hypothetical protein DMF84_24440 [Acidobacteriota bacterium]
MIRYRLAQPEVLLETPLARVMSFHKSKGLTAEVVVLAGLIEDLTPRRTAGLAPGERAAELQENRRLCFVGMTRTTRVLVLSTYSQLPYQLVMQMNAPHGPFVGPGNVRTIASTFLDGLGPELPAAIRGVEWQY